jgi:K+-sensing histidine kinase KdpD
MSHAPVPGSRVRTAPPSAPIAILWAGAAAIVPTLIRLAVDHVVSDITIFPAYFPFVLATATFLGWRSAIVATILSGLAANFMFMGARFAFSAALPDIVSTLLFLLSAGAVIVGVERLKAAAHVAGPDQGSSRPAGTASRPLARGTGILLAASLALASWAAVIWGAVRLFR